MTRSTEQLSDIVREITQRVSPAAIIRSQEPMNRHTTLRVGGPADVYVEPANEADLAAVLAVCREQQTKFFVLGRGSNLIVRDGGYRGVVICLSQPEFCRIEIAGETVQAGAGAKLKSVAVAAKRAGLAGLEFLEGIPGSVGGALRMNAGAMGGETFGAVEFVRVMDYGGQVSEMAPDAMAVTYRHCGALESRIALAAAFKCRPEPREAIGQTMKKFSEKRWSSQPAAPSAGCLFKNPAEIPAGRLIDELGLKGAKAGGAMISLEHGNFLVNNGGARAKDVLGLMELARQKALAERGVSLQTEVEIIGEDD